MKQDYEKLGAFYLGRGYDLAGGKLLEDLVLYDSKDLTTHGICFGMTGSGKTGLCVCLLEEALLDGIPVIALDPKGDLTNLLLTFPELRAQDFEPWIPEGAAQREGMTPSQYAQSQADLWREGLARWDQDGDRIRCLRDAADFAIYTPGSSAGLPVSLLKSFQAPSSQIQDDDELFRERVQAAVSGLLGLLGIDADPIQSRDHILLAMIFSGAWQQGRDLTLAELIQQIQKPPFDRIGMFDLESYYPARDRSALAMGLNNLLAAPGFSTWLEGDNLDIDELFYTSGGKPRLSIFSIAHLSDSERMFFVATLLNELLSWMRRQSGTSALRALFYMDEIFGFLPPVANPPSKPPMLTLLKQARASGLGVLLATQNPKDIDYKALGNIGTWFVGRLQTDRDQERVLDGLEGAAAGAGAAFDRQATAARLTALDKRVFILRNTHDDESKEFQTRWSLSYLTGPLTRSQIKRLMADRATRPARDDSKTTAAAAMHRTAARPILPDGIAEYFAPARAVPDAGATLVWRPSLMGIARVNYADAKTKVDYTREISVLTTIEDGPADVAWENSGESGLRLDDLGNQPPSQDGGYDELPQAALKKSNYVTWQKRFAAWIASDQPIELLQSPSVGEVSKPGENERDFRARLAQLGREERGLQVEKLRKKYGPKMAALQERIRRAEGAVEREKEQASAQKLQSTIAIGTTLLGALFGRKLASAGNVRSAGSAMRSIGRAGKESGDIERAQESVTAFQQQLADLDAELRTEIDKIESTMDTATQQLERTLLRPKKTAIDIRFCALTWLPYWQQSNGASRPAWK